MELYNAIVAGLDSNISNGTSIENYLQSLQGFVRYLRAAYKNSPVNVPYERTEIQAAYLIAYFPHYYQLLHKIIIEEIPDIFQEKENVHLTFIGGGPGPEAYGIIKYIANNCPKVSHVTVNILDINATTWSFSHEIVKNYLIDTMNGISCNVQWNAVYFDLISEKEIEKVKSIVQTSDLLVIQNCLNEIASRYLPVLKNNIKSLFDFLPGNAYFLISDLTSGARNEIKAIESYLIEEFAPSFIKSTLSNLNQSSLISVHHLPSPIIRNNLLFYNSDGLIPRKNLKYDYSLISKGIIEEKVEDPSLGFKAIYRPLDFRYLDANDYIHKKIFIGIDFGTSTTVVSTAQLLDGKIVVKAIPIKQKDHAGVITKNPLVPSIISLFNSNRLMVGTHAADHKPYLNYGVNCWHSFKQNLARLDQINYPDSELGNHSAFKISNAREGLTFFFKYLKNNIFEYLQENGLPQEVEYSISVPAGFSSKEKTTLKSCLINAGIECEDTPFIEEPNAALINYLFEQDIFVEESVPRKIMVLDLGAGTVDVSLILAMKEDGEFTSRLLSVVRLGNIGGNLIDESIASFILTKKDVKDELSEVESIELISLCEKLKIRICRDVITDRAVNFELPPLGFSDTTVSIHSTPNLKGKGLDSIEISYKDFNSIMLQYWVGNGSSSGIRTTIEKALENAVTAIDSVEKVIVTGGGGRNPYLKNLIARYFTKTEILISDNIQEQVSRGVALQSFILNSFGKNIIAPILSHNIYLKAFNKTTKLFDSGVVIPSTDIEIEFEEVDLQGDRYIECFSYENDSYKKYFIIPVENDLHKLVFYIAPDQELKCELVGKNHECEAKEVYEEPNSILLTIK